MMLSPSPFSLLCALLLCLPLAIIFTTTTPPSTTTSATTETPSAAVVISCTTTTITGNSNNNNNSIRIRPLSALILPTPTTSQKPQEVTKDANFSSSTASFTDSTAAQNETEVDYNDEEDNELFRLAGRVNSNPELSPGKRKKVAFLFLTTSPLPFAPLWELFFNQTPRNLYNIYVHADPSGSGYSPPFRGVFGNRVIPSKPTRRHTPALIAAARRLLSRALLHDKSNYMFALLSPSCVPLHSFNFTYNFLTKSGRSFIEILKDEPGAYDRWAARGEEAMLPEVKFENFRIGSQFFVLKRKHARAVARDKKLWSKFKLPCLSTSLGACYPEEHYFPTLLNMVDPGGCVPATLTSVDWNGSFAGHPRMYHGAEVGPELIWELRNREPRYGGSSGGGGGPTNGSDLVRRRDPFLFARKFSPDSLGPLMSIADDVLFKD
ncbi:OLC1v1032838C1 [Oldenlandia corymbosa var. corymbosa]|uniref:OLC1v1032838C1 n=1 Tax=Oldenlandia corymbosa var. corymbosa TaxID=529605 RepID=A0AAV1CNS4_OLDCO|nr:OLC1v1032838C1 [Oldenlandia corymbosa var. corymbosa]